MIKLFINFFFPFRSNLCINKFILKLSVYGVYSGLGGVRYVSSFSSLRFGLIHAPSWFNWWVSFAPEFQCCYFCEPSCLFYLSFNFDFYVSKTMHL